MTGKRGQPSPNAIDNSKLVEFRYQLWTRLCALADEAASLADAWWETDPELVELHYRRCGVRQRQLFDDGGSIDSDQDQRS